MKIYYVDGQNTIIDQDEQCYRNLWAAVLHCAIADYSCCGYIVDKHALSDYSGLTTDELEQMTKQQRDAMRERIRSNMKRTTVDWVRSESQAPCSFLWICGVLGLNPTAVRERVFSGDATARVRAAHRKYNRRVGVEAVAA